MKFKLVRIIAYICCSIYCSAYVPIRAARRFSEAALMDSTTSAVMAKGYVSVPLDDLLADVSDRPVTLPTPSGLKNKYLGLRHGESTANIAGVISSNMQVGSTIHGLTPEGRAQARRAATDLIEKIGRNDLLQPGKVLLVSSPFTRARETANEARLTMSKIIAFENEVYSSSSTSGSKGGVGQWVIAPPVDRCILLEECGVDEAYEFAEIPIIMKDDLRERYFGEMDGKELIFYNKVWPVDQKDAFNNRLGVESVQDVCTRCQRLLQSLESEYSDKVIVFSSHADTLQIMQMFMSGAMDPRRYAEFRFRNGELRVMTELSAPRAAMVYR